MASTQPPQEPEDRGREARRPQRGRQPQAEARVPVQPPLQGRPLDLPPPLERPRPRRTMRQRTAEVSLKLIALAAFVFGVAMHACIAQSFLESEDTAATSSQEEEGDTPPVIIATPTPSPEATATPTVLPDRTSCEEIEGTQYRSASEREFYLTNCVQSAAPGPTATPEPGTESG